MGGINDGVTVVIEQAKPTVQAHINTGRLNELWIVGLKSHTARVNLGGYVAIR